MIAMYLLAYQLAAANRWFSAAGLAARGVERIAASAGSVHAPRIWRRRARSMERRSDVA
jgi:hypothetical protein